MTKRTSRRRSQSRRQQRQRQNRLIISGVVGIVVLLIAGLVISNVVRATNTPQISADRLELDPVLGDPSAPVTLIEYGAYSCHACQSWHQAGIVEGILADYPGQVKFIFRDFPVISPAYDQAAAAASQCVLDQGEDLFWAYHDALYTSHYMAGTSTAALVDLGTLIGADGDALQACINSNAHSRTVQFDLNRASDLGLRGTPAFLVNDQVIYSASPDTLRAAVEQALRS